MSFFISYYLERLDVEPNSSFSTEWLGLLEKYQSMALLGPSKLFVRFVGCEVWTSLNF